MTRGWRVAVGIVVTVVALAFALRVLNSLTGGTPGGPRSSSYATGQTGLGAYAELLGRSATPPGLGEDLFGAEILIGTG